MEVLRFTQNIHIIKNSLKSCGCPIRFIKIEWACFNKVTAVSDLQLIEFLLLGLQEFIDKFKIYLQ